MSVCIRKGNEILFFSEKECLEEKNKLIDEIKNSNESKNLNYLIIQESISHFSEKYNLKQKYDENFYSSFFVNLPSLLSDYNVSTEDKKELKRHVIDQISKKLNEKNSNYLLLLQKISFYLYNLILGFKIDFNLNDFDINQATFKTFCETILKSNETTLFLKKFQDNIFINCIHPLTYNDMVDLKLSGHKIFKNFDHIENIYNIYPKKGILSFLMILKNKILYNNLYKNKDIVNDPVSTVRYFLECVMTNKHAFFKTLLLSDFHLEKHFKRAKKSIKFNFGLNDKGYSNFIGLKFRFQDVCKSPSLFSIIDLNNVSSNEEIKKILAHYKYDENNIKYKIDQKTFTPENFPFLNLFKDRLKVNELIEYNTNLNFYEEFFQIEFPFFMDFIDKIKNKTVFLKNVTENSFNNNHIVNCFAYYNNNTCIDDILNAQISLFRLTPNLFLNTKRQFSLFFKNVFFYFDNFYLTDSNVNYNLFYYLYSEYLKQNPSNANLFSILDGLLTEFEDYSFGEITDIQCLNKLREELNSLNNTYDEYYKPLLIQLAQKIIDKIGEISSKSNFFTVYMLRKMITLLTGIYISDYYPGLIFQSFCIEHYLVHLFESHYQHDFDINNNKDLKYISKLAEKYHTDFNVLLEKSFKHIKKIYDIFMLENLNTKTESKDYLYNVIKFKELENYCENTESLLINSFYFKPLINVVDLFYEGEKMNNCLYDKEKYRKSLDSVVFSVTHPNNSKFRVNFEIESGDRFIYISEGPYTKNNKSNTLLNDKFLIAKDEFLRILNKTNLSATSFEKESSLLTIEETDDNLFFNPFLNDR